MSKEIEDSFKKREDTYTFCLRFIGGFLAKDILEVFIFSMMQLTK